MKLISNTQFQEYQDLKHWAVKQKVWDSAKSIKKLEDDIDLPIRKCVAMCALLGMKPQFSCCGFDYEGQPYHKYHQYDIPYIIIKENKQLLDIKDYYGWKFISHYKGYMKIEYRIDMNPAWRNRDCIHSYEECALAIPILEDFLMKSKDKFLEEIFLQDTNENYHKQNI